MAVLEKTKNLIDERVFGIMPERPLHLSVRPISVNEDFLDGAAVLKQLEMELDFGDRITSIPFTSVIPNKKAPCPAVIEVRGEKDIDLDRWIKKGYAVFSIYYKDISENNSDFRSGISAYITPTRRRKLSAGKVCVWAWAAIRALECAADVGGIDESKIGVTGRGIFALSAILAGNTDRRFEFVLSEDTPKFDDDLTARCPHLFSPEFVKTICFDNNSLLF